MIRLDTTTRKLQIKLSGAVTTNQLPVVVCYSDKSATSYSGGTTPSDTNSMTAVDICAAPAASTVRDIDSILVRNADTAAATILLIYNDNGTSRTIISTTLAVGDQFIYTHASGWQVVDTNGNVKTSATETLTGDITGSGSGSIATTVAKIAGVTVSGVTGTGNVVMSAAPTFTGNAGFANVVPTGLIDASAAGAGQMKFPATQNASADAHTLDDYAEGTTTPTTTSSSGTITTQTTTVHYTKVGRRVSFDATIVITNNGSGAGFLTFSLPFSNGGLSAGGAGINQTTAVLCAVYIPTGGALVNVFKYDGTYPVATGQTITVSGSYDIS